MNEKVTPYTCNDSVNLGDIYICKIACKPCLLHFGEKCAKNKIEEALKGILKIMEGADDED